MNYLLGLLDHWRRFIPLLWRVFGTALLGRRPGYVLLRYFVEGIESAELEADNYRVFYPQVVQRIVDASRMRRMRVWSSRNAD